MKIVKLEVDKKEGVIVVCPENRDDLWFLYSFISPGDSVRGRSTRKVTAAATGTRSSAPTREVITTTLAVSSLEIAVDTGELRISGRNIEESEFVMFGSHHTLAADLHFPITITKKDIDDHIISELKAMENSMNSPEVVAVLLQPGKALICNVKGSMTFVMSKIEENMPQKREGSDRYERRLLKFYDTVAESLSRVIENGEVKAIIIGSAAFYKNDFYK